MLQNRLRKPFLNARPHAPPPHQGSALDPLRTSSGPQTPWRISPPYIKSWIRPCHLSRYIAPPLPRFSVGICAKE